MKSLTHNWFDCSDRNRPLNRSRPQRDAGTHSRLFSSGRTPLYPSDLPSFDLAHNMLAHVEKALTDAEIDTVTVL